jgi:hypothetical protein
MIRFTTESGSVYEADTDTRKIRRVSGTHEPTPHQGDGDWQQYLSLDVAPGHCAEIIWRIDSTDDGQVIRRTVTSPVVSVSPGAVT